MSEYTTEIYKISELGDDLRNEVVALYLRYYEGSNRTRVVSDLNNKNEIKARTGIFFNLVTRFSI